MNTLPKGAIIAWHPSPKEIKKAKESKEKKKEIKIPDGFKVCDGTSGTPDLRNRFILGATNYPDKINKTGGKKSHHHTGTTDTENRQEKVRQLKNRDDTLANNAHTHTFTTNKASNMPPYYTLIYIMKL